MVTYFNKKDLVSFGNYLLSDERKKRYEEGTKVMTKNGGDPLPTEERLKNVGHADLMNWMDEQRKK